jgi:membrane protease YdiL (CAAX protease family)
MLTKNKDIQRMNRMQDVASFHGEHAETTVPPQHTLLHSIWLSLLPGKLILLFAIIVGPMFIRAGLPLLLVPSLWVISVLIPFELGYLLYQGKKESGHFTLHGIVLYREPMPMRSYLLLIPPLIIWPIVIFLFVSAPIEQHLMKTLFFWMPHWFFSLFATGNTAGHPQTVLLLAVLLFMLTNPAAAFVEEFYFRGYLLPRIAYLRGWAPLINTVLFSFQHLFSPWGNLGRILAFLPVGYMVAWKKNIYIGIIVHCTLDLLDAITLLVPLLLLYR